MSLNRIQRVLVAAYPSWFRSRYGAELETVIQASGSGWSTTVDVARGVAGAWLRPEFGSSPVSRRDRLQSSLIALFLAWLVMVCCGGAFAKAVDDKPVPGLHSWGWAGYSVARAAFEIGSAAAIVGGLIYWTTILARAFRKNDRMVLRSALLPLVAIPAWLAMVWFLAWYPRNFAHGTQGRPGVIAVAIFGGFLIGTLVIVVSCGAAVGRTVERSALSLPMLAVGIVVGSAVSIALVVQALASAVAVTRVLETGRIGLWEGAFTLLPVVAMCAAAAFALVNSGRGLTVVREMRRVG